jgi:hypothetical protein
LRDGRKLLEHRVHDVQEGRVFDAQDLQFARLIFGHSISPLAYQLLVGGHGRPGHLIALALHVPKLPLVLPNGGVAYALAIFDPDHCRDSLYARESLKHRIHLLDQSGMTGAKNLHFRYAEPSHGILTPNLFAHLAVEPLSSQTCAKRLGVRWQQLPLSNLGSSSEDV